MRCWIRSRYSTSSRMSGSIWCNDMARRMALQVAAHEAILGHAQLQRRRAGVLAGRGAVLFHQVQYTLDAAHTLFRLALVHRLAECSDVLAGLVSAGQQRQGSYGRPPRTVLVADAMTAALLAEVLA